MDKLKGLESLHNQTSQHSTSTPAHSSSQAVPTKGCLLLPVLCSRHLHNGEGAQNTWLLLFAFCFFKSCYVALAVFWFTVWTRLASNSELLLPLPPGCCSQRCAPLHPAEDSVSCMTKLKTGVSISFYISVKFYKDHILIRASWSHLIVNLGPAKWLSVPATKSNNLSLFWDPLGGFSECKTL